ncbi:unnamed protein product [Cylindrotheca closterium]|uniref:DUF6824 domain-containing protein n=1 Tax=Cylindrotheca closterium TaxID=2856 RepID=A0AAD2FP50_9STRA|nr:unnamed protein product [Cylindrotheca closterium]
MLNMLSPNTKSDKTDGAPGKRAACSGKKRRRLRFEETINPNAESITNITAIDILFGRGRGYQDRPGNKRMRAIVATHKERYQALELSSKRTFVEAVYDEITRDGARFLHKQGDEEGFVMVEVPVALHKVRNLLRCKKSFGKMTDPSKKTEKAESSDSFQVRAIKTPVALSEGSSTASAIQEPSIRQAVAAMSFPALPLHVSSTPLLPMQHLQQASLASLGNPIGLQSWNAGMSLGSLPLQMSAIAACNAAEELQMLQQYHHHRRSAEMAHRLRSKQPPRDP